MGGVSNNNGSDRRADERLDVQWWCQIEDARRGTRRTCRLLNVSLAGALVVIDYNTRVGDEFIIHIDQVGAFAAEVRWAGNGQLGLKLQAGPDLKLKTYAEKIGLFSNKPVEFGP